MVPRRCYFFWSSTVLLCTIILIACQPCSSTKGLTTTANNAYNVTLLVNYKEEKKEARKAKKKKGPKVRKAPTPPIPPRGQPGDFDFYTLTLTWIPGKCHYELQKSGQTTSTCDNPPGEWRGHMQVHGIWPTYNKRVRQRKPNGTTPSNKLTRPQGCVNFDVMGDTAFVSKLRQQDVPNLYIHQPNLIPDPLESRFLQHEWKTHGTCSGLSISDYFRATLNAYEKHFHAYDDVLKKAIGSGSDQISVNELNNVFGKDKSSVRCNTDIRPQQQSKPHYFTEINLCVDKDTFAPVVCPKGTTTNNNCGDDDEIMFHTFDPPAPARAPASTSSESGEHGGGAAAAGGGEAGGAPVAMEMARPRSGEHGGGGAAGGGEAGGAPVAM